MPRPAAVTALYFFGWLSLVGSLFSAVGLIVTAFRSGDQQQLGLTILIGVGTVASGLFFWALLLSFAHVCDMLTDIRNR